MSQCNTQSPDGDQGSYHVCFRAGHHAGPHVCRCAYEWTNDPGTLPIDERLRRAEAEIARLRDMTECPTDALFDGLERDFEQDNPPNWEWVWTLVNRLLPVVEAAREAATDLERMKAQQMIIAYPVSVRTLSDALEVLDRQAAT